MWELACLRLRCVSHWDIGCESAIAGKPAPTFGFVCIVYIEEISDKDLGLPLGNVISSLRTPLQTQRSGVAARIT